MGGTEIPGEQVSPLDPEIAALVKDGDVSGDVPEATAEIRQVVAPDVKEIRRSKDSAYQENQSTSGQDAISQYSIDSAAKSVVGSRISIKYMVGEGAVGQKAAKFMNTYKMNADKPFVPDAVTKILESVVESSIVQDFEYDKNESLVKNMVKTILQKVREQKYDRYKYMCLATVGEKHHQGIIYAFKGLWDVERDNFAYYVKEKSNIFAIAICFGIYFE